MKVLLFAVAAVFILGSSVAGQQPPDFSTVKTEKGMMVLKNNKAQAFSFLVSGTNPNGRQEGDGSLVISTDSGVVVVYFVKTSAFNDKTKPYTEAETLAVHRDWDIAAQQKAWKADLKDLEKGESFVKVSNLTNKLFPTKLVPTLNWLYVAPKPNNADRTLYQTVLIGDTVLMLGAVFPPSVPTAEVRSFFKQTLESLTLLPPQDPAPAVRRPPIKKKVRRN